MKTDKIISKAVDGIARLYDGPPHGGYKAVEDIILEALTDTIDVFTATGAKAVSSPLPKIAKVPGKPWIYPDEIWVDTDLVGDTEPHEGWQRYMKEDYERPGGECAV